MLTYIIGAIILAVIVFLIVVAVQPDNFRISRSATITAPAPLVFAQVNDFHQWQAWSPWAKMDPTAKNTFEGAASGEGAVFHWAGNNQVGEGGMTILESRPDQLIRLKLNFLKPFQATHTVEFTFEPRQESTLVTWTMFGKNSFVSKAFLLFMDCDKMIGGQYEQGLKNLQEVTAQQVAATH